MSHQTVCILNYGSGNVKSVYNVVAYLGYDVEISNEESVIKSASHIILPGVGSFGPAMERIRQNIPLDVLESEIFNLKRPFLGICVGMQVLAEVGYEYGEHEGLGWMSGVVNGLEVKEQPLPHIGWNDLAIKRESILFEGLDDSSDFYFVHSFAFSADPADVLSETTYDSTFCSSVQRGNIFGVQFHPEKSQKAGQRLIKNFLEVK